MTHFRLLPLALLLAALLALPGPRANAAPAFPDAEQIQYNHFYFLPSVMRVAPGYPAAPSLSASAPAQGLVTLSWSGVGGAEAYHLWLSGSPTMAGAQLVYQGGGQQFSLTLPVGVFYFRVQASNDWGASGSNVVTVNIVPPPTPTPIPTPTPPPVNVCAEIPGASYGSLSINGSPSDRPAEGHADLNLALRGYAPTDEPRALVDYSGATDGNAPQLSWLFANTRGADIRSVYRVYDWNWSSNSRGGLITNWPVTLMGLASTPGEVLRVPDSGYDIGSGYDALVLYASESRITLKYTREDNVVHGYTVHVENVCVEPRLLSLYRGLNASGRRTMPAVYGGQPIGRATGDEVGVTVRDTGSFMDPRSRKDWWRRFP